MKETPILFSGPMVTAILEGRKTQTRRVAKPQYAEAGRYAHEWANGSPYGKPGDRLWVREDFSETKVRDRSVIDRIHLVHKAWRYKADEELRGVDGIFVCGRRSDGRAIQSRADLYRWTPAIRMPREASRIDLEITNVRVERLQDISAADIEAEGTPKNPMQQAVYRNDLYQRRKDFEFLWDKINGKKHPWASNPWVWVVEFRRAG